MSRHEIRGQIFMGSSHTLADMGHLYNELGRALNILGGIQQPGHPETEEDCKHEKYMVLSNQMEVDAIAREIYMALTGKVVVKDKDCKRES